MFNVKIKKTHFFFTSYFIAVLLLIPNWPGIYGYLMPKTNAIPLLVLCALALVILFQLNPLRLFLPTRNILLFFFLNLFIIAFFRPDLVQSIRHGVGVMLTMAVVLFLTTLLHSTTLRSALLLLSWNLTLAISLSAIVHLQTNGRMTFFVHDISTRVSGLFYYADNAMMASVSILLSFLAYFISEKKTENIRSIFLNVALCSILLASTDTRSAMLALVVSIFFILTFSHVSLGKKIILISLGIVVLASGYFFLHSGKSQSENEKKIMIRQMIWSAAINGIKQRPVIGYGNKEIFFQSDTKSKKINREINDAHNAHLMHMLTFGIPSWCIFVLFLLTVVRFGVTHFKNEFRCFHAILIFWLIVSFFWGRTFLLGSNVNQMMFMVSVLGIFCHPDIYKNSIAHKYYYVFNVTA